MENSLKNIFAITELRNRVLFTLGLLGVYRIGHHIPTPGVNTAALAELARQAQNTMFGLYDMFTGGSLSQVTIFALGVMPYISASIILQLLTVVWPYMEKLSKEGELGRRKIAWGFGALILLAALLTAFGVRFPSFGGLGPSAPVEINFEHPLRSGVLKVFVDDALVLEEPLESWVKDDLVVMKVRKGRLTKTFSVAAGDRVLRLEVDSVPAGRGRPCHFCGKLGIT